MAELEMDSATQRPIVRLISFGAGFRGIEQALKRVSRQAHKFPWIDEVRTYSEADLSEEYLTKMGHLIATDPKGFGLWSWKPFLIEREMNSMKEGDVLVYVDAGIEINPRGAARFTHYLDYLARKDALLFSLDHQHRQWTKNHPLLLDFGGDYFRNQVVAGVLMFRVAALSRDLVTRWKELCLFEGGKLLLEPESNSSENHHLMKEHRHDQALLSKAVFELGIETLPDETIFAPWSKGKNFPFLALRNKGSSFSWLKLAFATPFIFWRVVYVATTPHLFRRYLILGKSGQRKNYVSFQEVKDLEKSFGESERFPKSTQGKPPLIHHLDVTNYGNRLGR